MLRAPFPVLAAAVLAVAVLAPQAARAATTTEVEAQYAALLRSINPHLADAQSRTYARSVLASSQRSHLDPRLLTALVAVESGWHPDAVSYSGAQGLGQLMPSTARGLGVNPSDPAENLRGAAHYLRTLLDRFAGRGQNALRYAIGAYNAGPLAVERSQGVPANGHTPQYVRRVLAVMHALSRRIPGAIALGDEEATWIADAGASALADSYSAIVDPSR